MTKYQLKDKKSQESLVDGRGMWHRLDKQPVHLKPSLCFVNIRSSNFLFSSISGFPILGISTCTRALVRCGGCETSGKN